MLLVVYVALSVATIGVEAFGISAITGFLTGDQSAVDMLAGYDQSLSVVSMLSAVSAVATGVLWAIWQYRAAKQVAGLTRRVAGWHAWSWFVPVISLWFPYQNISDLWRAIGRTRPAWQIVWWLLWLAGNAFVQQSTRVYLAAEDLEQLRVSSWLSIVGELLLLAAAPLAVLIVRRITQGILQRASAPADSLVV